MKRLIIAIIGIFMTSSELFAEHFVGKYLDDSPVPVEYQLVFETLEDTPDEVGVYYNFSEGGGGLRIENLDDITNLRLPETVTFEGKTYTVTTILELSEWSNSGKVTGTLYIPKTVTRINGTIALSVESIVIPWNANIGNGGVFADCLSIRDFKVEGVPDGSCSDYLSAADGILYYENLAGDIWLAAYPAARTGTNYAVQPSITRIMNGAFAGAIYLEEVSIPESVWYLGDDIFAGCHALKKVNLPQNTEFLSIGAGAFSGCISLEEVTIPKSVKQLSVSLFAGCLELKKVSLPDGIEYIPYGTFSDCNNLKEISLPDNIVYISGSAFADCESLAEIKLPAQLKTLGNASFRGCKSLETLTIPDGVAEIRANTLSNCTSLKSVTLPARLDSIQYGAFQGCSSLQEINLPSTLSGLGERAFKDCSSLRSVNIPTGVRNLGVSAFENCTALKTADTGDGMEKIGEFAFYNCSSLENMTLGVSLTEIGDEAFMGDDAITSIVCKGATPPDYFTGFSDTVMKNAIVTVPEGAEDIYHNNPAWTQMVKGSSIAETIITEDMEYSVYSITGICLRTGCRDKNIDGLPQGTYILRYSNGVTKKLQL